MRDIDGGVTAPRGYTAGVAQCGIKHEGRPDLMIIASGTEASCAGVFTTNRIQGAPVLVSRENVRKGAARAIVANSGNANVCNGEDGIAAALAMTGETALLLECDPAEILVASTGVIGREFPLEKVVAGIPAAVADLSGDGSARAARAIMTTDMAPKETAIEVEISGIPVRVGAIAKGAGMIRPDMATMFCFVTTDADIEPAALRKALRQAVDMSFNCITVDGDMSTSDTVLVLANGQAGNATIRTRSKAFEAFASALGEVCLRMAKAIVSDGEGATKFIAIRVTGAAGIEDARQVGLAIANSALVKTAFFGNDPNWGRIICAAGYSGVPVDENRIVIALNGTELFNCGRIATINERCLRESLAGPEVTVDIDLGIGNAMAAIYTSDLSYEYVKINAEYTT